MEDSPSHPILFGCAKIDKKNCLKLNNKNVLEIKLLEIILMVHPLSFQF